jgi:hypothetical protein
MSNIEYSVHDWFLTRRVQKGCPYWMTQNGANSGLLYPQSDEWVDKLNN